MTRVSSFLFCLYLATLTSTASAQDLTWTGCEVTKTAFMSHLASAYEEAEDIHIALTSKNATAGIRQTATGQSDFGGSSRRAVAVPIERKVRLHPVAWDALVAVVHPSNPVDSITLDRLKQIFSGDITNWKSLGGPSQPLKVYTRQGSHSAVGQTARELLLSNQTAWLHSTKTFPNSADLLRTLAKSQYGIALDTFSSAQKNNLKILHLNNVNATAATIKNGSYPLVHPLYLVTTRQPTPAVKKFVMWAQSATGQAIIEDQGTVSLRQGERLWLSYRNRIDQLVSRSETH